MWGSRGIAPNFLTSALDGGEWLASRRCRCTLGERAPGTHWIEDWVSPRVGLEAVENRKIVHCRESNPDRPTRSPRYSDWAIPTLKMLQQYNNKIQDSFNMSSADVHNDTLETQDSDSPLGMVGFGQKIPSSYVNTECIFDKYRMFSEDQKG
jgi:hypothetical protein